MDNKRAEKLRSAGQLLEDYRNSENYDRDMQIQSRKIFKEIRGLTQKGQSFSLKDLALFMNEELQDMGISETITQQDVEEKLKGVVNLQQEKNVGFKDVHTILTWAIEQTAKELKDPQSANLFDSDDTLSEKSQDSDEL